MLSIFETGDASFRLTDRDDVDVGWIRGSAIGFDGFLTETDAVAAAVAGAEALAAFLERLTGAALQPPRSRGRVRVRHDGDHEAIVRGDTRLARLHRPHAGDAPARRQGTYGVEFVLPSYVKPGAAISASQVVHRAIGAPSPAPPRAAVGGVVPGVVPLPSRAAAGGRAVVPDGPPAA